MTGLLTLLSLALVLLHGHPQGNDPTYPSPERMMRLQRTERSHEDLYIAADTEFGMYQAPTWLGVYTNTGRTDLSGAYFIWKSGLEWFDNIEWHQSLIGGRFMEWTSSYIEVLVILASKESIILTGWLDRKPGCWTDYDTWVAPSFVDQYGDTWPETQLGFDWPSMQLQSLIYRIPSANGTCTTRTYTMQYMLACDGINGILGVQRIWIPWPANPGCIPAKQHNTTFIDFRGTDGKMTLYLADGIKQVFYGKPITPPTMKIEALSDGKADAKA